MSSEKTHYLWRNAKDLFEVLQSQQEGTVNLEDLRALRTTMENISAKISTTNTNNDIEPRLGSIKMIEHYSDSSSDSQEKYIRKNAESKLVQKLSASKRMHHFYTPHENDLISQGRLQIDRDGADRRTIVTELATKLGRSKSAIRTRLREATVVQVAASQSIPEPVSKSPAGRWLENESEQKQTVTEGVQYAAQDSDVIIADAYMHSLATGQRRTEVAEAVAQRLGKGVSAIKRAFTDLRNSRFGRTIGREYAASVNKSDLGGDPHASSGGSKRRLYTAVESARIVNRLDHAKEYGENLTLAAQALAVRMHRSPKAIIKRYDRLTKGPEAQQEGKDKEYWINQLLQRACTIPGNIVGGQLRGGLCVTIARATSCSRDSIQQQVRHMLQTSTSGDGSAVAREVEGSESEYSSTCSSSHSTSTSSSSSSSSGSQARSQHSNDASSSRSSTGEGEDASDGVGSL